MILVFIIPAWIAIVLLVTALCAAARVGDTRALDDATVQAEWAHAELVAA